MKVMLIFQNPRWQLAAIMNFDLVLASWTGRQASGYADSWTGRQAGGWEDMQVDGQRADMQVYEQTDRRS